MKKVWDYGTSTPIQRVGVIFLVIGLLSLFSWMIKEDLSFEDLFEPYYLPRSRDSFFFHLFFYFIPLGLLMSWGYQVLVMIKAWIINGESKKLPSEPRKVVQRQPYTPPKKNLHFKNNPAAFKYASENYIATMNSSAMNVGIVQDINFTKDKNPAFLIQIADKGKTTLVAGFNDNHAEKISKGNLVYWGFVDVANNDQEISAVGHVLATLYPELDPNNGRWIIKSNLTK
ncbi:hypothetical protein EXE25_17650 [Acinetobacter bouvetii]|uniref:Uncharacterized protein n=1 Tax=Acinetobacter bouvetii TaxID=202951 RepID=A0A4Q7AMA9_9GAMM|nr:hypothetical protein [Acinetobacter bouvetii]RZG64158.1 hypothetical protein EXE25_17650 [Acinetobacter bouvetii]